jgi:RimJ/RimL family protein N-acetyltransferase
MAAAVSTINTENLEEVWTTLPIIENLPQIENIRLIIRPLLPSDAEAYGSLQNQPNILFGTDSYLSESPDRFLHLTQTPLSKAVHFGLFRKENPDDHEGDLIGEGGIILSESSWPSIYCRLRQENQQSAGPFFYNLMENFWWSLPRRRTRLQVYPFSLVKDYQGIKRPIELLCVETQEGEDDKKNEEALKWRGFEPCGKLANNHTYWRSIRKFTFSTTIPILDNLPTPIQSSRLIIRPFIDSDIKALHSIRSQEKPMILLGKPKPDLDQDATRKYFEKTQSDLLMISFGIFLKENDGHEGEMIGYGGVRLPKSSWPEIHYIFKEEHWGKGYGTEYVKTLLSFWWSLPRQEKTLTTSASSVDFQPIPQTTELLCAWIDQGNLGSQNVVKKAGFKIYDRKNSMIAWKCSFP